jgi:hypothetical protein
MLRALWLIRVSSWNAYSREIAHVLYIAQRFIPAFNSISVDCAVHPVSKHLSQQQAGREARQSQRMDWHANHSTTYRKLHKLIRDLEFGLVSILERHLEDVQHGQPDR